MQTLAFYFKLALLCFKLGFNLLAFAFDLLFIKLDKKILLNLILLLTILVSLSLNFYLWQEKNTLKNTVVTINSGWENTTGEVRVEKALLTLKQVHTLTTFYQDLEGKGISNQAVLLNLGQLLSISEETEQSEGYFTRAQKI